MPTTYAIPDGRTVMAATTYTGTGATQVISNAVNGVSMQPDFVWLKSRSNARDHRLMDTVRGINNVLQSNLTSAEFAGSALSSINSSGFTLNTTDNQNVASETYVGWQWKAGGTAVSNAAGSITSSVSANTTAGFSVVTWTGIAGGQQTVGHGLGVAPVFIISKNRTDAATDWYTAAGFLPGWNYSSDYLKLNSTAAKATDGGGTVFPVAPTSTVFTVGDAATNGSGKNYVAYCFAPVAGYSAFGSYTGNASTDGPFVYLGFRPRFVMIKRSDSGTNNWETRDTARDTYNTVDDRLFPNTSGAEDANNEGVDFLSNGFKIRNAGSGCNASGATYIYMTFAENPFKYANAR
jgi:hypothetical protein